MRKIQAMTLILGAMLAGVANSATTTFAVTATVQAPDNATNRAAVPGSHTDTITVTVTH